MTGHRIASREEWLAARKELLRKEKEFTRLRDQLTEQRRQLPWTRVRKEYEFDGPEGKQSLSGLFGPRGQLIIYHFMFDPEWEEGCKSCSLIADHYDPLVVHLRNRDVSLVTVSRAPLEKLLAYRRRMGWSFPWVSSFGSDFNRDFHVTFTEEEVERKTASYNFGLATFPVKEAPGISVFARENGQIFHTYSSYARGLESFMGVYRLLDIVPKGRDEARPMDWVRHHDRYGA